MSFRKPKIKPRPASNSPTKGSSTLTSSEDLLASTTTPNRTAQTNLSRPTPIGGTTSRTSSRSRSSSRHPTSTLSEPFVHLIQPSDVPRTRRSRFTSQLYIPPNPELFVLPGGQSYTQSENCTKGPQSQLHSSSMPRMATDDLNDPFLPLAHTSSNHSWHNDLVITHHDGYSSGEYSCKRERQWVTWSTQIIPALIEPYFSLLRATDSLRVIAAPLDTSTSCAACNKRRSKSLLLVSLTRKY